MKSKSPKKSEIANIDADASEVIQSARALVPTNSRPPMNTILADIGRQMREAAGKKLPTASIRTPEVIDEIVMRLSSGETMASIHLDPTMPSPVTLWRWERDDPDLSDIIDWARQRGQHPLYDAMLDISMGGSLSTGSVDRDALLLRTIRDTASKRNRKDFGERVDVRQTTIQYSVKKDDTDW